MDVTVVPCITIVRNRISSMPCVSCIEIVLCSLHNVLMTNTDSNPRSEFCDFDTDCFCFHSVFFGSFNARVQHHKVGVVVVTLGDHRPVITDSLTWMFKGRIW